MRRGSGQRKRLDLFVVDPLASFLPGHSESDPGTLLTMLQPLQMLAGRGVAVLILHHPRKEASEEGSTARGSGALLGYVDIILELHRFGRLATDECRRKLVGLSRHKATPRRLGYEWSPDTGAFQRFDDLDSLRIGRIGIKCGRCSSSGRCRRRVATCSTNGPTNKISRAPARFGIGSPARGQQKSGVQRQRHAHRSVSLSAAQRGRRLLRPRRIAAVEGFAVSEASAVSPLPGLANGRGDLVPTVITVG